ncbi:MAG: zinc-binding alcohol dehydrogenase [Clostridiales bacterium]|nr:zinc-binding alcohol dehydrogenase [Clostridiales bacterium]
MKTLYAQAQPGKVVLAEKELPAPGPGQVLLKAKYSAMSPGTENGLLGEHIVPLPTSIGYAMAAEVVEVGPDVRELKVGDHVVTTGEHAQYLIMDELNCTICPEGVDLKQASFWNLGHTGMYALRRSGLQLGEPCAVLGQGFVGAITAQVAKLAGAIPVIVTDLDDGRLEAAKKMGVDIAINSKTDPDGLEREVNKLNRGGLPVIFEATGARGPLMQAAELIGERGRLVMISQVHGEAMPPIDDPIMQKGASLIGTYVNSKPFKLRRADLFIDGVWPPVMHRDLLRYANSDTWTSDEDIQVFLNLIAYGKLDITPLISHEFKYTEITEAYAKYVFPKVDPAMTGGVICWTEE